MVTMKDLTVEWIQARATLKQQLKEITADDTLSELPDDHRQRILGHLKVALAEFDALLKDFRSV